MINKNTKTLANIIYIKENYDLINNLCYNTFIQNKLAVIPTDTVYGISGNYFNSNVRKKIIQIKNRPSNKGFIVLLPNIETLLEFTNQHIPSTIIDMLPAPLTLIVKNNFNNLYNEKTIAVRIPNDPWINNLLNIIKIPLISTSANLLAKAIPKTTKDIINNFSDKVDLIVLKKSKPLTLSSTILDISQKPYRILRQGSLKINLDLINNKS